MLSRSQAITPPVLDQKRTSFSSSGIRNLMVDIHFLSPFFGKFLRRVKSGGCFAELEVK